MTSYIEQIVEGLGNLAPIMNAGLAEVRLKDEITRNMLKAINKEEAELLEKLKQLAKIGTDFDEEPLKAQAASLIGRRRDVSAILDDQNKFSIGIYQHLDQKIKDFDISTKGIAHLFPDSGNALESEEVRRKRKKKSSTSKATSSQISAIPEDDGFDTHSVFDPNEPKYCKCRRVSFGSMVACENPDCAIEWFHFECVGLKVEPADPWFCSSCREPPPAKAPVVKDIPLNFPPPLAPSFPMSSIPSTPAAWKERYDQMVMASASQNASL